MTGEQSGKKPRPKKPNEPRRLTEQGVLRMKPPPPPLQKNVFDTGSPGLVLRVGYGGAKTFNVVHYPNQKPQYFKLGRYHPDGADVFPDPDSAVEWPRDLTLAGARDAARKFFAKPSAFLNPQTRTAAKSFKSVAEDYLVRHAAEFRSLPELKRQLTKYIYPVLQDRLFVDIKRSEVITLRTDVADNHGASQADAIFSLVRGIMRWFEAEGDDDDYVCPIKARKKKAGPSGRKRKRILSADEIKLVWEAAGEVGPYGAMVRLLLLTAQRREKVSTMRWADLNGELWSIPSEDREKGNAGILRLPPFAMAIIAKIDKVAECSYVFAGRYGDKPFNSFSQGKEEINEILPAEMPRWTLHNLRHTARTVMTDLRVDDRVAEQVLGHAIEGVEGVYNQSQYLEQKAEALARLAGYIQQLVEPAPGNVVAIAGRRSLTSVKKPAEPQ
jgi:integrase